MNTCPCCGQSVPNEVMVSLDTNTVSRNGHQERFTPQTIEVLNTINDVYPGVATYDAFMDAIYGLRAEPTSENPRAVVKVLISHARRQLARMGIKIVPSYGEGYRMVVE